MPVAKRTDFLARDGFFIPFAFIRGIIIATLPLPHFFMSCCSACGCGRPMCTCKYAPWFLRIAFGLVLVSFGVNHYRHIADFITMVRAPFDGVAVLGGVAEILAYIVPALMIVGGVLFAIKQQRCISKTCIYAVLGGIIGWASLGVLVGNSAAAGTFMPVIQSTAVLVVFYWVVRKLSCCCCGPNCNCSPAPTK